MRIGLYGMPGAGKTFILNQIDFLNVKCGSKLLREYDPDFDKRDLMGRKKARIEVARKLLKENFFIMDGHYSFGDEISFTSSEGEMYDIFLYLFVAPKLLKSRMASSYKNKKYLKYDLSEWQLQEIFRLREYCHKHNKDFYVIDNPPEYRFDDISLVLRFIKAIVNGYSCLAFAKKCAEDILTKCHSDKVVLLDGDKTLTIEDTSSAILKYKTNLYDGNFYTGFQSWKQDIDFKNIVVPDYEEFPVKINRFVEERLSKESYILTSGHHKIWENIANKLGIHCYTGSEMSADTKLYITKFLHRADKYIIAYGDGMNDYYMLKEADEGYLIRKEDQSVSRSLIGKDLEGIIIV